MTSVLWCICLLGTASTIMGLSDLELQYIGIKKVLESEQKKTRLLEIEISELKKAHVSAVSRSISTDNLDEFKQKQQMFTVQLDRLKSGLEAEKHARHEILGDLGQVKEWTKNLITKTSNDWKNAIVSFSTGNEEKTRDYQAFKTQAAKEWNQWGIKANETLSKIESSFKKTEAEFHKRGSNIENRIDSLAKDVNCYRECDKGWNKSGCLCYRLELKKLASYAAAKDRCEESGSNLIQPVEIAELKSQDSMFVWAGVSKDGDQPWKHADGTETFFNPVRTVKTLGKLCGIANTYKGKLHFLAGPCTNPRRFICVKR